VSTPLFYKGQQQRGGAFFERAFDDYVTHLLDFGQFKVERAINPLQELGSADEVGAVHHAES